MWIMLVPPGSGYLLKQRYRRYARWAFNLLFQPVEIFPNGPADPTIRSGPPVFGGKKILKFIKFSEPFQPVIDELPYTIDICRVNFALAFFRSTARPVQKMLRTTGDRAYSAGMGCHAFSTTGAHLRP
jgi:hypothetical protein